MQIASIIPLSVMWPYLLGAFALILIAGMIGLWLDLFAELPDDEAREKVIYKYRAKETFITNAERDFYNALGQAVGKDYRIFAQVHLASILESKIKGQYWKAARAHIDRKSVDFLLCDKDYLAPKLAIELDDSSHERGDRVERDTEVERILKEAGLPLLRIKNQGTYDLAAIANQVQNTVSQS